MRGSFARRKHLEFFSRSRSSAASDCGIHSCRYGSGSGAARHYCGGTSSGLTQLRAAFFDQSFFPFPTGQGDGIAPNSLCCHLGHVAPEHTLHKPRFAFFGMTTRKDIRACFNLFPLFLRENLRIRQCSPYPTPSQASFEAFNVCIRSRTGTRNLEHHFISCEQYVNYAVPWSHATGGEVSPAALTQPPHYVGIAPGVTKLFCPP